MFFYDYVHFELLSYVQEKQNHLHARSSIASKSNEIVSSTVYVDVPMRPEIDVQFSELNIGHAARELL